MLRFLSCFAGCSAVVCLAALVGCAPQNEYQEPPPPPVTVARPIVETVTNYLEETGTTEAVELVQIRARVTGFLEEIHFEPGQDVNEGDVLYVIEQRPFQAEVAAVNAELKAMQVELNRAEIDYKRELDLQAQNATTERDVLGAKTERDAAQAAVAATEAALDRAELDLEYTTVTTPISGRVGKTLVKVGNLVDSNEATHLTTVIKYDPIYANFNISEPELLALRERRGAKDTDVDKEKIKLYLKRASDKGFPFEGRFDYADLAVDQSTGTFMIRGLFPNPNLQIVPGLFVRIRLPVGQIDDALLVPRAAIGFDQEGRYLFAVNSANKVERRNVDLGPEFGDMQVILEGLRADDSIIVRGVQRAREGALVTPEKTTLPPWQGDGTAGGEDIPQADAPPPEATSHSSRLAPRDEASSRGARRLLTEASSRGARWLLTGASSRSSETATVQ